METVCGKQSGSRCVLIMVRDEFLKTSMKIVALFHNKPVCYIYGKRFECTMHGINSHWWLIQLEG